MANMDSIKNRSIFTAELATDSRRHWYSCIPFLRDFVVWFKGRRPLITPDSTFRLAWDFVSAPPPSMIRA